MTERIAADGVDPVVARADGTVGGATVAGRYVVALARDAQRGDALAGVPDDAAAAASGPLAVVLGTLDGAGYEAGVLMLALPGGGALDLAADSSDAAGRAGFDVFAARVIARAYAIPELTRALRAFAAHRGAPGSDHDRFFAPLLGPLRQARDRLAMGADGAPWLAAELVDPKRVAADLRAVFGVLAAERAGGRASARRALEAELDDVAAPLFAALDAIGARAAALDAAPGDLRLVAWRAWTDALGQAFRAADAAWEEAVPALADPRGGMGRLWRTLLRQRGLAP